MAPLGYGDQDYFLEWEINTCTDSDGDGALDISCGGDDCSPFNPTIHPQAFEDFGETMGVVDRNCDGFVQSESCHEHDEGDPWFAPTFGSVPSLAPSSWKTAYDIYTLNVNAGDCVVIQTDILQTYGPMLTLWAKEGGFDRISSWNAQYLPCSREAWADYGGFCPRGNFVATQSGEVSVAIGQQTSFGPTASSPTPGMAPANGQYKFEVFVNGAPRSVDLVDESRITGAAVSPF
jgi:hypothetical protein